MSLRDCHHCKEVCALKEIRFFLDTFSDTEHSKMSYEEYQHYLRIKKEFANGLCKREISMNSNTTIHEII